MQIEIAVPKIVSICRRTGKNQIMALARRARIQTMEVVRATPRSFLLKDNWGAEILILQPGSRSPRGYTGAKLSTETQIAIDDLNRDIPLCWKTHPALPPTLTPDEIAQSWAGKFCFQLEDFDANIPGLREPQIGAIHALAGYLTIDSRPATIVMPTGTGKTETLLSIMVYRQLRKVLILVPSTTLRHQIAEKAVVLGNLPDIEVLPADVNLPVVGIIKGAISSTSEAEDLLRTCNVLVSTPQSLTATSPEILKQICDGCSALFVDEAHHIAARTWKGVRGLFENQDKAVIQFTATPFRNDGSNLEGKIVFNYPLSLAQEKGYFRKIRFYSVREYIHGEADRVIAERAIAVLREDLQLNYDHVLMARCETKERAVDVVEIYRSIQQDWEPQLIHSGMTSTDQRTALQAILARRSRICVCVKMLGEGFDFPNLKIAAIHDMHRSLAITLQFVGRFVRRATGIGEAAFIANIAEPNVDGELQALYAQSPDWDQIIRQCSEERIGREVRNQELIDGFRTEGDLTKVISLWNLRPAFSCMVFKAPGRIDTFVGVRNQLPKDARVLYSHNASENLFVCVAERNEEVSWGRYRDIKNYNLELLVIRHVKEEGVLFIHASDYEYFRVEKLAEELHPGAEAVVGDRVFRVFSSVERPMVRNLGARQVGDISFTMYFGSNVLDVLTSIEKGNSELSNLVGWGYEDGDRCTWGCSQRKGKIWSIGGGDILDWLDWTNRLWAKVSNESLGKSEIISGFLCAELMTQGRPHSVPVAIEWGSGILLSEEQRIIVGFGPEKVTLYETSLEVAEYCEEGPVRFAVVGPNHRTIYALHVIPQADGAVTFQYVKESGEDITVQKGSRDALALEDYLRGDPPEVVYASGDRSHNQYLVKNRGDCGKYDASSICVIDWAADGIDLSVESQGSSRDPRSIQNRMALECLSKDYDLVFDDDASGEAADLVCIKTREAEGIIEVLLVHCKFALNGAVGANIENLYQVCGQAQKSIYWKHVGMSRLIGHLKHREGLAQARGFTRFMRGDFQTLEQIRQLGRRSKVDLSVWIVQPGLDVQRVSEGMLRLLGATEVYLGRTSRASLKVFGSGKTAPVERLS